jgi:hypothetical protein
MLGNAGRAAGAATFVSEGVFVSPAASGSDTGLILDVGLASDSGDELAAGRATSTTSMS